MSGIGSSLADAVRYGSCCSQRATNFQCKPFGRPGVDPIGRPFQLSDGDVVDDLFAAIARTGYRQGFAYGLGEVDRNPLHVVAVLVPPSANGPRLEVVHHGFEGRDRLALSRSAPAPLLADHARRQRLVLFAAPLTGRFAGGAAVGIVRCLFVVVFAEAFFLVPKSFSPAVDVIQ